MLKHTESKFLSKKRVYFFKNRLGLLLKVKIPYIIKKKVKFNSK